MTDDRYPVPLTCCGGMYAHRPTCKRTVNAYDPPTGHPMTVRVTLTVTLSRDRVSAEFGYSHTAADVREYVRRECESAAASALSTVEADVSLVEREA